MITRPIYCDESVWVPVAHGLEQRGWQVYTASGEDTLGDSDRQQLQYALDNDWLLLTFDDDFFKLVNGEDLDHAGIIYIKQDGKGIGDIVKEIDAYLDALEDNGRRIHYP